MTRSWVLFLLCACATGQEPKRLVVPEGMRREVQPLPRPENKPPAPALQGALQPAAATRAQDGRYVLRLAEHNRLWELELPESAGGYEMRIPLDGPLDSPTAADAELLASAADRQAAAKTDPVSKGAPTAVAKADATAKVAGKSYLGTLAKVREMYASRRYELALVELVDLEASHPKDARLQAMKGSVYLKLGKAQLARESWQKALALDPEDPAVAEALRTLKEE
ncbi:MAG: tetratricopeptide repeat protein [Myxococcales bacterium]